MDVFPDCWFVFCLPANCVPATARTAAAHCSAHCMRTPRGARPTHSSQPRAAAAQPATANVLYAMLVWTAVCGSGVQCAVCGYAVPVQPGLQTAAQFPARPGKNVTASGSFVENSARRPGPSGGLLKLLKPNLKFFNTPSLSSVHCCKRLM